MSRPRGSIIGARPTWTTTATSGIWTLRQAEEMQAANQWPRGPVAPTSLAGTPGDQQVALTWVAPATTHGTITDYLVEYTPAAGSPTVVATGSTAASYTLTGLTNDTEYTFRVAAVNHTRGDWSSSVAVTPSADVSIEYLVVAGGGGGGTSIRWGGHGGGGGEVLGGTIASATIGSPYTVTIGAGGVTNGTGSSFDSFSASPGLGATGANSAQGRGGTSGSGFLGGTGYLNDYNEKGGGGGGDSAAGQNAVTSNGGSAASGGAGTTSTISGASIGYGGGGGGGGARDTTVGTGLDGGGDGGVAGSSNTGGGGGGSHDDGGGKSGGSGVVVLKCSAAAVSTTGSPTVTTSGGFTVYTFTGSGSITF